MKNWKISPSSLLVMAEITCCEQTTGSGASPHDPAARSAFAEGAWDKLPQTKGMFEMTSLTQKALHYEYKYILN